MHYLALLCVWLYHQQLFGGSVISSLNCQKVPFGGLRFINQALKQNDDLAEILLHFVI